MIELDPLTYEEAVKVLGEELEPDKDEARNGWDKESLTIYHAQRRLAEMGVMPSAFSPLPESAAEVE